MDFTPGDMVFFYSPKPKSSRFKKDGGAWRGPAVVLMRESEQRFFVSWRGRCLLVSTPNLRLASMAEAGNQDVRREETEAVEQSLERDRGYEDLSHVPPPPPQREEVVGGWEAQEAVIRPSKKGIPKSQAKEIARSLKGMKTVIKTVQKRKKEKDLLEKKRTKTEAERDVEKAVDEIMPPEDEIKEDELWKYLQQHLGKPEEEGYQQRLRRHLQDDLPLCMKRPAEVPLEEEQARRKFRSAFFNYTMVATSTSTAGRANEWASRQEVRRLAALLNLPVVGARYHHMPRKRFHPPPTGKKRARITVMLSEEVGSAMVCQESALEVEEHPRRRGAHEWKGVTLFVKEDDSVESGLAVVELPDGVYEVHVSDLEKWNQIRAGEEDDQAYFEAYLLMNKMNGKELDPRHFSTEEKETFDKSDAKEWASWIKNRVVRRLTPEEAALVDKRLVFKAPARMVRTNKGALQGVLQAKSRLVIPGHLDPHLGEFRSDAPTTLWSAVQLAKGIAATRRWSATTFDVATAFLSGKEVSREVYIKAPPEGLPVCEGERAVEPNELLRVCKSAYGLSEAPRLWYLRAVELLEELKFEELRMCKATFIRRGRGGAVVAILCLHVDDGFIVADKAELVKIKKEFEGKFTVKEWQDLGKEPVTFLGVKTTYLNYVFTDSMVDYVQAINYAEIYGKPDDLLEGKQLSVYRRLVMQLHWPAHLVMPGFLYVTSALAQQVSTCCNRDLKKANEVLKSMKEEASKGGAQVRTQGLDGEVLFVSYFDASLGKSTTTKAQQGEVHFTTTKGAYTGEQPANLIEFHSNRISRVVRSSLAAEGCAMTSAGDRMMFNRVLYEAMNDGRNSINGEWRKNLKVGGCLVTDAKGLHDHVHKSGGVASEKQVALDMLMIKQMIEEQTIALRWVPTWKQIADPMTKEMSGTLLDSFRNHPVLSLVQTEEDRVEEQRRSDLRRAQRERRKVRMKAVQGQHLFPPM